MIELCLVLAGMILFLIALVLFVRVYLLVEQFVEAMWVRCCWWALGLLVVLFLFGYALFIHFLLTADSLVLDHNLVIALVFFWGSVFVLLSSWLFYATLRQRNRIEDELLETTGQLLQSQKTEALGRLAGGVAHDFNNVLTVIMSFAEVGSHYADENPDLLESLNMIKEGAERGRGLTDQLLAFCRKQSIEFQSVSMEEVLKRSQGLLKPLIPADITIKVDSLCRGWVNGAAVQLDLILMNLILNARDAQPEGGQILISLCSEASTVPGKESFQETDRFVVLTVTDTGKGMDRETSSRIFEPYFTTKVNGTGLGLSMVAATVDRHGGQITVDSEPGKGTVFRVSLPEVPPVAEERPISQNTVPASTGSFASARTVLIVDDDERIRRLMALVLRNSGYHVLEAQTGADALHQCDLWKRTIHLLITDVAMPVMDGPEVARQVQRIYPGIKIVFVSGYSQEEADIQKFIDEGGQFLAKPFVPGELRELVGKTLEQ